VVVLPKTQAVAEALPASVEEELTNLRGFADLVNERWGYWMGARLKQQEGNQATAEQRKAVREAGKAVRNGVEDIIKAADVEKWHTLNTTLSEAKKVVKEAMKPFAEKISPLRKAVRYLDSVAIPDALKELGKPISPRFSLSEYIDSALKAQKKK
jgi:hypothetical protein